MGAKFYRLTLLEFELYYWNLWDVEPRCFCNVYFGGCL